MQINFPLSFLFVPNELSCNSSEIFRFTLILNNFGTIKKINYDFKHILCVMLNYLNPNVALVSYTVCFFYIL